MSHNKQYSMNFIIQVINKKKATTNLSPMYVTTLKHRLFTDILEYSMTFGVIKLVKTGQE